MPVASQDNSQKSVLDDRALLRRFVQDADEAAFAEIVFGGDGLGGGGLVSPRLDHPLIGLINRMTSPPCVWDDTDPDAGGTISLAGNSLVVRQSKQCHEEIVKLLNLLTNAENTPAK